MSVIDYPMSTIAHYYNDTTVLYSRVFTYIVIHMNTCDTTIISCHHPIFQKLHTTLALILAVIHVVSYIQIYSS